MDIDKYKSTIPYPNRSAFYVTVTVSLPSGKTQQVQVLDDVSLNKALAAYKADIGQRHAAFRKDLLDELGIANHPKAGLLFAKAWDWGRRDGLGEVINWAQELAELL